MSKCNYFVHIVDLLRLPDIDASTTEINNKQHLVNAVISNFCVLVLQLVLVQWLFCRIRTNPRVDNCFIKVCNIFFYVLSKFDNYFDTVTVDLNWPLNHRSLWINCRFTAKKQLHVLIIVLSKLNNCFFRTFLLYAFKF